MIRQAIVVCCVRTQRTLAWGQPHGRLRLAPYGETAMAEPASIPNAEVIINAVKQLNAGYENKNYAIRQPEEVAGGNLYTVVFQSQDGTWMENYVFERGKFIKAYWSIRDVVRDSNNGIVPKWNDREFIRLGVVSILTIMFAIAVIG
jgi:hypothetical protein